MMTRTDMTNPPNLAGESWLNEEPLQQLLGLLSSGDGEARVAGGAVRNALLGEPIADLDIATTLLPEQVRDLAIGAGMSVHDTGLAHGTVTVVIHDDDGVHVFEVTTLRIDTETDGRRAKVAFTDDWYADASRRDFTINAMYCDAHGSVLDLLGGYEDLQRRTLRFAGNPHDRITEDHLRILRFFRFHARFGFEEMDASALQACIDHKEALSKLSGERVRAELLKLLVARGAVETVHVMDQHRIFQCALDADLRLDPFKRMCDIDEMHTLHPVAELRLAVLVDPQQAPLDRLKLSNNQRERIFGLPINQTPSPRLREPERQIVLYQMGVDGYRDAVRYHWALSDSAIGDTGWLALLALADDWQLPVFPVTGSDLIAKGLAPGPEIGDKLRALEDWWMASGFPDDKNQILEQLQT